MTSLRDQLQAAVGGTYSLGHELEGAGMSRVFVADETGLGRRVVIKALPPETAAGVSLDRFKREIHLAAKLQHPHIVPLLTAGKAGELLYYTMPFVDGESLRARLEREGELPVQDVVRVMGDVLRALSYAHQQGVVHRDIKPDNILLAHDAAVVADFGVAKALSAATEYGTLTSAGVALGTPTYMAPEQAAADPAVDRRADLYALGVVAYEMLAGRPPFTGRPQQVLALHAAEAPVPIQRLRPNTPPALATIVMRLLEKRPADRPQSAEEATRALEVAGTLLSMEKGRRVVERTFRLTEQVCRKLDRETLRPGMIGDDMHYLDNEVASDVLIVCLHGCGMDQETFAVILQTLPYRALAPTLYGFGQRVRRRVPLPLHVHLSLLRELMASAVRDIRPTTVVLAGFSSGGDMVLRFLSQPGAEELEIDAAVTYGCNLALETCFATKLFARLRSRGDEELLSELRDFGNDAQTVEDWLKAHEYLVRVLRKFQSHMEVLQLHARDLVRPFEQGDETVFPEWYRAASARVRAVRCVFEDSPACTRLVEALRMRNLDHGILGEQYRDDALVIEPDTRHFDLLSPERFRRHVEEVLQLL